MTDKILSYLQLIAEDVLPVGHAKIAAAIVYKRAILSIGICSYKTHPFQKSFGRNQSSIHLHAEMDALIKARKRALMRGIPLKKCKLYVARVKRPHAQSSTFVTGLARPCSGCLKAITDAGITEVYYTID